MKELKIKLDKILDKFKGVKIGVVGDYMLDEYIIGNVARISPEAPVPIVNVKKEKFSLGGAGNVANNISALGGQAFCFGLIGIDNNGAKLTNSLMKEGADVNGIVKTNERATTVKTRVIGGNQQLLRIDWENSKMIETKLENQLLDNIKAKIKDLDGIILSDYDKGVLTSKVSKEVINLCKKYNKIVVVDPKPKNILNYIGATSMTPNRKEAMECMGLDECDDFSALGIKIREKLQLNNLLLTRSEEGMSLFMDKVINIPTFAKEVYDVTGAGDTVISVFTMSGALGIPWEEAAKIANTAAGVVVSKAGTSTVSKSEIIEFYNEICDKLNLDKDIESN